MVLDMSILISNISLFRCLNKTQTKVSEITQTGISKAQCVFECSKLTFRQILKTFTPLLVLLMLLTPHLQRIQGSLLNQQQRGSPTLIPPICTHPNMDHGSDGLWPATQHMERAERMPETQKHRNSVKSQGKWNLAVYLHFPVFRLILFLKSLCEGGMPVLSKVFSLWKFKM